VRSLAFALVIGITSMSLPVAAHDAYDDSQSHPLQIAAWAVHPVGWALEWLIARPLHFVVSQPEAERIFGHEAHENPYGAYEPYRHDVAPDR
jgi:hypothetical protein